MDKKRNIIFSAFFYLGYIVNKHGATHLGNPENNYFYNSSQDHNRCKNIKYSVHSENAFLLALFLLS